MRTTEDVTSDAISDTAAGVNAAKTSVACHGGAQIVICLSFRYHTVLPDGGIHRGISRICRDRKPVGGKDEMAVRRGFYVNVAEILRYKE